MNSERGAGLVARLKHTDPALLRLLLFFGGLIAVLVVLIVFDEIFFPLLLGLAIAYLFDPAVSWFENHGRSRVFGVIVITLVVVLAITGFFLYLVPAMGEQFERLAERLPQYQERLEDQLEDLMARAGAWLPKEGETPAETTDATTPATAVPPRAVPPDRPGIGVAVDATDAEEPVDVELQLQQAIRDNLPTLAGLAGKALRSVGKGLKNFFDSAVQFVLLLLNLIFVPVFAFYLLVDFPHVKRATRELIPLPYRELVTARVREVDQAVAGFVRGQLTIAMILAAINSIGLLILGVPLGLVIGIVAGMANMIPYMALVVGLAPAMLLSWAEHQSLARLLGVVAVFSGAQLLEGTVLSPRILGGQLNLHPVWVLLAVIAGGSLFGFIGMLVAVPAAAAIQVFVRHWLALYKGSRIYSGELAAAAATSGAPAAPIPPSAPAAALPSTADPPAPGVPPPVPPDPA